MKLKHRAAAGMIAMTVAALSFTPTAIAQEVTGVAEDAPIVVSPELADLLTPEELEQLQSGETPRSPQQGPGISPMSWQNCKVYENRIWPNADRHACFQIEGSGLWADWQGVGFNESRTGEGNYTYVNARFNIDRPNGMYYWGTDGGAVNIMNGYTRSVPINAFIEAGNWCMRFQLQRTSGAWEDWQEVCGPVWA